MYPNYNYYTQQQNQISQQTRPQMQTVSQTQLFQQQQQFLKGRPVSSLEEVKAMAVDFDGTIFFFPDLANKKIYTKQIGMDGGAILNMYELKEIPIEIASDSSYVTREEFDTTMAQIRTLLENYTAQFFPMTNEKTVPEQQMANNQQPEFNF